jgi:hypothetical protein
MERFLRVLESLGAIIEETSGVTDIMCFIWGPAKLLLQVIRFNFSFEKTGKITSSF